MTQTEALKSAIEFAEFCLEELDLSYMASNQAKRLVQKAKEALAQPEQEPVAWFTATPIEGNGNRVLYEQVSKQYNGTPDTIPLYTTPPQRKPLTDEEYSALAEQYTGADGLDCVDYGRAIARHYGIKE